MGGSAAPLARFFLAVKQICLKCLLTILVKSQALISGWLQLIANLLSGFASNV